MLGKLMKYDLRSMLRMFLLVWGAALALSLINHFTLIGAASALEGFAFQLLRVLLIVAMVVLLVAMAVMPRSLIIQRFYNGLLRDEGYLMFTLPVKTWQLILSKLFSALILLILSLLVGGVCVWLLSSWEGIEITLPFEGAQGLLIVEFMLVGLLGMAASIYQIYVSIALGHLFKKRRVLMSFVMYFAINALLSILGATTVRGAVSLFNVVDLSRFAEAAANMDVLSLGSLGALGLALVEGVQILVFHLVTEGILRKRLNLE